MKGVCKTPVARLQEHRRVRGLGREARRQEAPVRRALETNAELLILIIIDVADANINKRDACEANRTTVSNGAGERGVKGGLSMPVYSEPKRRTASEMDKSEIR